MEIIDRKNKEVLFDTKILDRFSLEQLKVLRQQVGWEIKKRLGIK